MGNFSRDSLKVERLYRDHSSQRVIKFMVVSDRKSLVESA